MKSLFISLASGLLLVSCTQTKNISPMAVEQLDIDRTPVTISENYMDKGVKPSEDFFQFANGTWVKNNQIPASESRWGSSNELEKSNKEKLTRMLEEFRIAQVKPNTDVYLLGAYYNSYIDMETRNKLGVLPITAEVDRVKNSTSKKELIAIVSDQHVLGMSSLFSLGIAQDLKLVNKNVCYLSQCDLGLPNKSYYGPSAKKELLDKYKEHIIALFILAGYSTEAAAKIATNALQFETELASAMLSPVEMRNPEKTYNKLPAQEVTNAFGNISFPFYLASIGGTAIDSVVVTHPAYLAKLAELYENKSLETWKDYLLWCTINHYAGSLSDAFVQEQFNFYGKTLSGKSEMKGIKDRAIDDITNKQFGELLGKAFVAKYFSEEARKRINTMVDDLLFSFKDRITHLDWMSDVTKKEALLKLNSIGRKLGFPDKWNDYSGLNFSYSDYVGNMNDENRFMHKRNMAELQKPIDRQKWEMPAHMVNAYYHPMLNEIVFPAGIMQAPFFDEQAEDAVNYGRIGCVIGHEFTHGFDDTGSKFAADGSLKNWWTETDRSAFEKKTATLGETFAHFCPMEGTCLNADLTMGENIADLGGVTMAYYAYTRTEEFKKNQLRAGYTPAQRFFIAYAQLWKVKHTPEEMKKRIANDSHSPGMYRVNGPLMNCPEFWAAFGIKEGEKMRNPINKVSIIW